MHYWDYSAIIANVTFETAAAKIQSAQMNNSVFILTQSDMDSVKHLIRPQYHPQKKNTAFEDEHNEVSHLRAVIQRIKKWSLQLRNANADKLLDHRFIRLSSKICGRLVGMSTYA